MKIEKYVAPDLTNFDKRLAVIEENSQKQLEYTRDIKIDLKNDVRRLDDVVADVERTAKMSQRETDNSVRDLRTEVRSIRGDMEGTLKANGREVQATVNELKRENQALERKLEGKIKQALDNPLANR
jgi:tetrahydromethanopterin S-methyltransferase subunit F